MKITIIGTMDNCDALAEISEFCQGYDTEEGQAIIEDEGVINEDVIGDFVDFDAKITTEKAVIRVKN